MSHIFWGYFVETDSVNTDSDRVSWQHLLGRNLIGDSSQVHTGVFVYARKDEEQAWPRSASFLQASKPEYDRSLVFLDNFDTITQREW